MFKTGLGVNPARRTFITVFTGFAIGFTGTYLILEHSPFFPEFHNNPKWFQAVDRLGDPHSHADMAGLPPLKGEVALHSPHEDFHKDEDLVAKRLAQEVRVLCWIMTSPANHQTKAKHVLATWGKRCNTLLFMSSANDSSLPVVILNVLESHELLWAKTKAAFTYVYEHHSRDYDWVLKADDDTYVIMENLRYLLYNYNSSDPLYFGCRFKPYVKQGYMSGGAGYVLSKEAVSRLVSKAIPDKTKCRPGAYGAEDVEVGVCLENVGVVAMDSRDQYQRGRFFPFSPENHLIPHLDPGFWYWSYIYYNTTDGMDCCSDLAITFHYISPQQMYVMEYLIYHLRPYGIQHHDTLGILHTD
ncbi:hypothetical protein J6590_053304 [Homalodisca vitripennis]|nr:hypothetical protein J6590_053304 [Homalodisca vitripennis]